MKVAHGVMKSMQGVQQTSHGVMELHARIAKELCVVVWSTHIFWREQPEILDGLYSHHVPPPAAPTVLQLHQEVHFPVSVAVGY